MGKLLLNNLFVKRVPLIYSYSHGRVLQRKEEITGFLNKIKMLTRNSVKKELIKQFSKLVLFSLKSFNCKVVL